MTKFAGLVGLANTVETSPGVWEEQITARRYLGDVSMAARRFSDGDAVTGSVKSGAIVSVVGDKTLLERPFDIRYCTWRGVKWSVSYAEIKGVRVVLTLGERYNG